VVALAGKQGLFGKVDKFRKISTKISKELPDLEPRDFDLETSRLELVVESIEEPIEEPIEDPDLLVAQLPEGGAALSESDDLGTVTEISSPKD
jgi:DNA recombination protein RmuC